MGCARELYVAPPHLACAAPAVLRPAPRACSRALPRPSAPLSCASGVEPQRSRACVGVLCCCEGAEGVALVRVLSLSLSLGLRPRRLGAANGRQCCLIS
jgi:hypothetical protein